MSETSIEVCSNCQKKKKKCRTKWKFVTEHMAIVVHGVHRVAHVQIDRVPEDFS